MIVPVSIRSVAGLGLAQFWQYDVVVRYKRSRSVILPFNILFLLLFLDYGFCYWIFMYFPVIYLNGCYLYNIGIDA
jgi:hypothetical protein